MPSKMKKEPRIQAWHFAQGNGRLGYGDNRVIRAGRILHVPGQLAICEHGLHASRRAIDALRWSRGALICRVEVWGSVVEDDSKLVGQYRKVLWKFDGTSLLHEFACRCAEDALRVAKVTDKRCWAAIEAKRRWLLGKATVAELDAARAAARDAAGAAARDAAGAAAWDAAGAAAWDAAWAACAAAWDAARAAAWAAAWDAARAAQNRRLVGMITATRKK